MLETIIYEYKTNQFFTYYILGFVCILGLIFGSFLNVVGLRLLSGESIVLPPSKCPACNTKLKWYDNIPVIAYILLQGKCRYCKKPISIQYPVVEAFTAVMFLLVFSEFDFSYATILLWILFCGCIVMCITDFKEQVIFDVISLPLIPTGLVYSFFNLGYENSYNINIFNTGIALKSTFIDGIIGVILAFLIFEIISLISKIIIKHRAFGEGDTIIAMIFGAWFGWKVMIIASLLGIIIQALFTLPLMISNLIKMKDKTSIISFSVLLLSAIIPVLLNQTTVLSNLIVSLLFVIFILGTAIISAIIFLKRVKKLNCLTLLPFGPALIVAGFITAMYLYDYICLLI